MIPVSKPSITEEDIQAVMKTIRDGWVSSRAPVVRDFEEAFSRFHDADYGIACSSGTMALQLALSALHLRPGDEVIVPEFTMVATAWAVEYAGGIPVFVDCDEKLLIDPSKIEAKVTSQTRAIVPVHIYGRQCDMQAINAIAYNYNLYVVEDSCEAHGIPLEGDIACFSFFANKIVTAGEGGICITKDLHLASQMDHLRNMSFDNDHTFLHKKHGYNFRMTGMQAALALSQTKRLEQILEKRRKIEQWYMESLPAHIYTRGTHDVMWMMDVEVDFYREELREFLSEKGIETRLFFKPMSQQPMYFKGDGYKNLLAYRAACRGFYLPTYTDMTKEEVDFVCASIKEFYGQKTKG